MDSQSQDLPSQQDQQDGQNDANGHNVNGSDSNGNNNNNNNGQSQSQSQDLPSQADAGYTNSVMPEKSNRNILSQELLRKYILYR
jgi:hypothetical protein